MLSSRRFAILLLVTAASGCKKDETASSTAPAVAPADGGTATAAQTATDTATTAATSATSPSLGTLMLSVEPKAGADASSIAGATLSAVGHPEIAATADAAGNLKVEGVTPGTVTLLVASEGGAGLVAGTSYGLKFDDVVVKAGEAKDLGKNALKETGVITGKVVFFTNPNDLDLTGSEVFVPGTSFIVKTDATGQFTLPKLPEGTYALRAQHRATIWSSKARSSPWARRPTRSSSGGPGSTPRTTATATLRRASRTTTRRPAAPRRRT